MSLVNMQFKGGGPCDGASVVVMHSEKSKLKELRVGGGYFWTYDTGKYIYAEQHPRFKQDFQPPKKVILWLVERAV
jgi:hypothetical protein